MLCVSKIRLADAESCFKYASAKIWNDVPPPIHKILFNRKFPTFNGRISEAVGSHHKPFSLVSNYRRVLVCYEMYLRQINELIIIIIDTYTYVWSILIPQLRNKKCETKGVNSVPLLHNYLHSTGVV